MIPPPFRYVKPASLPEALTLLASIDGAAALAGGQSLVNALKLDLVAPEALIDVHRLPELRAIEAVEGALRIGAAVTYAELANDPLVLKHLPALAAVAGGLVDRQVRNRGTIGGNCCLNDPTNNLPPLLACIDATFEVQQDGAPDRILPAAEFFLGTLLTVAHGPALLTAVTVPLGTADTRIASRQQLVGADSWALAKAVVRVDVEGDTVVLARVYLGAVPDSPRRLAGVEAALEDAVLGTTTVTAALSAFDAEEVQTLGDSHGSAAYRLAMTRVQLKRALQDITTPTSSAEEAVA